VVDGHPMARNGQAGRALGAALASSCVGGIFGALVLALALPLVKPGAAVLRSAEKCSCWRCWYHLHRCGQRCPHGARTDGGLHRPAGIPSWAWDPIGGVSDVTPRGQLFSHGGVDLDHGGGGLFAVPEMLALMRQQAHHGALPWWRLRGARNP